MHRTGNLIEAALWGVVGLGFAFAALRHRRSAGAAAGRADLCRRLLASVTFLAFGASDVVEADTGAWWRPWWLLAWKAACLAVLLTLLIRHVRMNPRRGA